MVTNKTESESSQPLLARLAGSYGVQLRYRDALGDLREASRESLIKTLLALGANVGGRGGVEAALERRETELSSRVIEPVLVAWEGRLPRLAPRLPGVGQGSPVRLSLMLEDGGALHADLAAGTAVTTRALLGGSGRLPFGRHHLTVEAGGTRAEAWVISAPRRCRPLGGEDERAAHDGAAHDGAGHGGAGHGAAARRGAGQDSVIVEALDSLGDKPWGIFAPVYALRSQRDWGAGDLADLAALTRWTGEAGGSLVATLPLLASSFTEDHDPSPYRPVSRLFWNEFFLAPEETEEWRQCVSQHPEWGGEEWRRRGASLRALDYVDYAAVMALKRPVMSELARCFFERGDAERRRDFEDFLAARPHAREYAAFRAAKSASGRPAAGAFGGAREGASPEGEERYHLYCQWQMDRQLAATAAAGGPGLLFDLPLGVHPLGFDAQTWPGLFATGMSTGAPPDRFFAAGQDWCTPPLRPDVDRARGYEYLGGCFRTLMRHAAAVRIDHMMSFHRLFWIPEGASPKDGVYVGYPAEELYALLCCESWRNRTAVVGEDLGTVPAGVRADMRRHGVARTAIFLGSLKPGGASLEPKIPEGAVVTLETHDMVPLAGFLRGDDITMCLETGQLDPVRARSDAAARRRLVTRLAAASGAPSGDPAEAAPSVLARCLAAMARSAAQLVLVNLEDLLLERRPQNVPGTNAERPNWRRKAAVAIEDLPRYSRSSK